MESYGVHDFSLSPHLIYVVLCGVDSSAHRWDLSDRGIWISWCEVPANIWHAPPEVSARGESDHGTLPVPLDCFPSTYTWDQNILFFISLHFKCGLVFVLFCFLFFSVLKECWAVGLKIPCVVLYAWEMSHKGGKVSRDTGSLPPIRAKQGDPRLDIWDGPCWLALTSCQKTNPHLWPEVFLLVFQNSCIFALAYIRIIWRAG